MRASTLPALAFALTLLGVLPANAEVAGAPPPDLTPVIASCPDAANAGRENADTETVNRAMTDLGQTGFDGLARHIPKLQRVLDRAPACYPLIEARGEHVLVRTDDPAAFIVISTLLNTADAAANKAGDAVMAPNTYGAAAFLLGSWNVENQHYEDALALLDKGLALQPHNELLFTEKVAALQGLRRNEDALAVLQDALSHPDFAFGYDRGRLLRLSGVVLIDLERLDEAEASLNESIRVQPDNPGARRELAYIAQLRAGAPTRPTEITAPNAPK